LDLGIYGYYRDRPLDLGIYGYRDRPLDLGIVYGYRDRPLDLGIYRHWDIQGQRQAIGLRDIQAQRQAMVHGTEPYTSTNYYWHYYY